MNLVVCLYIFTCCSLLNIGLPIIEKNTFTILCFITHALSAEVKKNSAGEEKTALVVLLLRRDRNNGPGRENPRTLAPHH
jgi:hypothetical protein